MQKTEVIVNVEVDRDIYELIKLSRSKVNQN